MEIRNFAKKAGVILLIGFGLWLFVSKLLPVILPFFLAFLLAFSTERAASYLMGRCRLPRWAAATICTLGAYALLFLALWGIGALLWRELRVLGENLPRLLSGLSGPLDYLHHQLKSAALRLPDGIGAGLGQTVDDFFTTGAGLLERLPQTLLSLVTTLAQKIPALLLGAVTTVIASFMTAAGLPRLRLWLSKRLPATWREKATRGWYSVKATFGSWLTAQLKLSAITFCLTTAGLFLLRLPGPLFAGLCTALVDILPVFGSGAVLIPWAMTLFLRGRTALGVALLVLYGITAITRATMEPRLLGRQMGLPPLAMLAAVYVGGKLCGLTGLILFPLAASVTAQFLRPNRTF